MEPQPEPSEREMEEGPDRLREEDDMRYVDEQDLRKPEADEEE